MLDSRGITFGSLQDIVARLARHRLLEREVQVLVLLREGELLDLLVKLPRVRGASERSKPCAREGCWPMRARRLEGRIC